MRVLSVFILLFSFGLNANAGKSDILIPFRSGELWGYCTPDKKMVVPAMYEKAGWFHDGLAKVAIGCNSDCWDSYDGNWGYINEKGKVVIPIDYTAATDFNEGKAWVYKNTGWFVIDRKGKVKKQEGTEPKYREMVLPEGFTVRYNSEYEYEENIKGFVGPDGTEYWEEPEAVFYFPYTVNDWDPSQLYVFSHYLLTAQRGKTLSPSMVRLTKEGSGFKVQDMEVLKTVEYNDDDKCIFSFPGEAFFKQEDDVMPRYVVACSVLIPSDSLKQNTFFNIYSKGIRFVDLEYGNDLLYFQYSMFEWTRPYYKDKYLEAMVEDIRNTGSAMKDQEDLQNVMVEGQNNPYAGKMIFDVMENVTQDDVWQFLRYVEARPFIYMGQSWKLSEVFATWVVEGAPRVK